MSIIHLGKFLSHYHFKYFFFSSFFSFWYSQYPYFICPTVLKHSVLVFFILVSFCCSVGEISLDKSTNSLTVSLAQPSLQMNQKPFFISVTVFLTSSMNFDSSQDFHLSAYIYLFLNFVHVLLDPLVYYTYFKCSV